MGQRSIYTPELGDEICERLAEGRSLNSICKSGGMPNEHTCRRWALDPDHDFAPKYVRARAMGYDRMSSEIIDIADNSSIEDLSVRQFQVDVRKWTLSKVLPKVFGDKTTSDTNLNLNLRDERPSLAVLLGLAPDATPQAVKLALEAPEIEGEAEPE